MKLIFEPKALAARLEKIPGSDVSACMKVSGLKRAFYFNDRRGDFWSKPGNISHIVLYVDRPGEVEVLSKKEFEALFATSPPQGNEKIREKFAAMPLFREWRERLQNPGKDV